MLPAPDPVRLAVPPVVEPAPPPAFPWVATLAPVAMALVLFAITGTPSTLMFAALGPVVAVGAAVDGRRTRRRNARRARAREAVEVDRVLAHISSAHQAERARLTALAAAPGSGAVVLGTGRLASAVVLDGVDATDDGHRMLRDAAAGPTDGPVVVDVADGIAVRGTPPLARAVLRAIGAQLDDVVEQEDGFRWGGARIAWVEPGGEFPSGCAVQVDLDAGAIHGPGVVAQGDGFRAHALTAHQATQTTRRPALPLRVAWNELTQPATGLAAAIGRDADADVVVDLIAEGPHALVAGMTGSGKSELLVSWILGLASTRPPSELSFLLVDFKGGAAFAPLAGLPHVTGILSDLDPRLTRRAIESLRAELLRRERLLADRHARSIDDLAPGVLARLVIVVDEFAALVATSPELHEVFADLAARGRSLGLHLILCTQRPAGAVRDAILANVGLRICLHVTDRGDSIAMVGDDAAARLPAEPRGRAVLRREDEVLMLQVAVSSLADAEPIARGGRGIPTRPWLDPLPAHVHLSDLPPAVEPGRPFGLLDLPAEQSQPTAVYDPTRHGHLLVLGAGGAGTTTALATLCAGGDAVVVSPDPADAWHQLTDPPTDGLLVIDAVDALIASAGPELGHDLIERLTGLLRSRAPAVAVSAQRLTGPLGSIAGLFGSRLLLRQNSRDEHVLAGGAPDEHDPAAPPGSGTWRGSAVQVADAGCGLPVPRAPDLPRVRVGDAPVLAVVAARPADLDPGPGVRVVRIGRERAGDLEAVTGARPTVLVGDPDAWQSEWALLAEVRRSAPIVLIGCTAADHRALLREPHPPPLGTGPTECWLSRDGVTVRAVFDTGTARESEEKRPPNR